MLLRVAVSLLFATFASGKACNTHTLMTRFLYTLIFLFTLCSAPSVAAEPEAAPSAAVSEQQPRVSPVGERGVRVVGANGQTIYIYNVAGVCVQQTRVDGPDRRYELSLPRGCYIVKVGDTVRKISIR